MLHLPTKSKAHFSKSDMLAIITGTPKAGSIKRGSIKKETSKIAPLVAEHIERSLRHSAAVDRLRKIEAAIPDTRPDVVSIVAAPGYVPGIGFEIVFYSIEGVPQIYDDALNKLRADLGRTTDRLNRRQIHADIARLRKQWPPLLAAAKKEHARRERLRKSSGAHNATLTIASECAAMIKLRTRISSTKLRTARCATAMLELAANRLKTARIGSGTPYTISTLDSDIALDFISRAMTFLKNTHGHPDV